MIFAGRGGCKILHYGGSLKYPIFRGGVHDGQFLYLGGFEVGLIPQSTLLHSSC